MPTTIGTHMKLNERTRSAMGISSMIAGLALMLGGASLAGEHHWPTSTKIAVGTSSAVGGGILTFVVARRLLSSPEDQGDDLHASQERPGSGEG